jgi:N-formylglutamate amidohydrolase
MICIRNSNPEHRRNSHTMPCTVPVPLPLFVVSLCLLLPQPAFSSPVDDELLIIRDGDLPILITAPHGGKLDLPDVPARTGDGLKKGPSGFFAGRDTGTEELALKVVELLDQKLPGSPSCVISRVHRKYIDFNRPPEIAVEHSKARVVYDSFHHAARSSVQRIRAKHSRGLLIDIHGQGSSASTVYRGTSNGVTVEQLRRTFGEEAHTGPQSLLGLLAAKGWKVHPDPGTGREQAGFTGGFIVRTYGSGKADGIDAIQLEFGIDYRRADARDKTAEALAAAVTEWSRKYLGLTPEPVETTP